MYSKLAASVSLPDVSKLFEPVPKGTVNMGIGEPDFPPTKEAAKGLKEAVDRGQNKYAHTQGLPQLRKALARRLSKHDKVIDESNILVTASATQGLALAAMTFYAEGDEVLIPDPGFFYYRPHVRMMGAIPVPYALTDAGGFQPDANDLASLVTGATKAIVVNTPSNPTGVALSQASVKAIVDLANDKNLVVISDEVYSDLQYDGAHQTLLGRVEKLVYINSFSKIYALTGWRIGYMSAPPTMFGALQKMFFLQMACVAEPIQRGALAALKTPKSEIARRRKVFMERRDAVVQAFQDVPGMQLVRPTGAFYAFPSFTTRDGLSSAEFADALMKGGVRVTPGIQFGAEGEGHVRLAYAMPVPQIRKGISRVAKVAQALA
jgi:aspartate aminotransferase